MESSAIYKVILPDKDATGVGWIATVEGEQQIQSWEAEGFNFWAAAWSCTGKNISNAIAIVDANANAACEVFCVGIKLGK